MLSIILYLIGPVSNDDVDDSVKGLPSANSWRMIGENINKNAIQKFSRLYQESVCTSWTVIEDQRLLFHKLNQKSLRADSYKSIKDVVDERRNQPRAIYETECPQNIGRKVLSSSYPGSPRWYNAKFQDAMAIVREYHKPDLFITMTCNPNWPEISNSLLPGQNPQDRPEIVSQVFNSKKIQLIKDITKKGKFGRVVAHMHVIEFQKRGLPHAHILIILNEEDRLTNAEKVDNAIVAELPNDTEIGMRTESEHNRIQRLEELVLLHMTHGPCGAENPACPCMIDGKCSKDYPKEFLSETIVNGDNFYAIYRRRNSEEGGRIAVNPKSGRVVDNRWIVPHNPTLCLRYDCHINVEACTSPKAAKYLYKYVHKGNDRAMVKIEIEGETRDEISDYQDLRVVGSSEASWHILGNNITERYPPVLPMRVHLKDQQQVIFDENTEEGALITQRETELTAFFKYNQKEGQLKEKYIDMPKTHVYDNKKKEWRIRKRKTVMIGRVHTVNPIAGDVYFLRMLLNHDYCKGKGSYDDMLRVAPDKICENYKEVCLELGLLSDDGEWTNILEEAAETQMCPNIRQLYIVILIFCLPSNPRYLFDNFWETWIDDYKQDAKKKCLILNETQLKTMLLLDLEIGLQSFEKNLGDYGLPIPTSEDLSLVQNVTNTCPVVIREELEYDQTDLENIVRKVFIYSFSITRSMRIMVWS